MNEETIKWAKAAGVPIDGPVFRIMDDYVDRKKATGQWQRFEWLYPLSELKPEELTVNLLENWLQGKQKGQEIIPLK